MTKFIWKIDHDTWLGTKIEVTTRALTPLEDECYPESVMAIMVVDIDGDIYDIPLTEDSFRGMAQSMADHRPEMW